MVLIRSGVTITSHSLTDSEDLSLAEANEAVSSAESSDIVNIKVHVRVKDELHNSRALPDREKKEKRNKYVHVSLNCTDVVVRL